MTAEDATPLLRGLIDYAGLFPPAARSLPAALERYDRHERGPDAAMLGRFVLPADRRDGLAPWLRGPWHAGRPLRLAVLVDRAALAELGAFAAATAAVRIEALELRAPAETEPDGWLAGLVVDTAAAGLAEATVHVELARGRDGAWLAALGRCRRDRPSVRIGAKLRCGGVVADLLPAPQRVAEVLAAARDHAVPLKFTAGLHHPVRGMDAVGGVPMHGFLNVYGAALLAHAHGLDGAALLPVLAETDPRAFALTGGGLAWRGRSVAAAQIAALRQDLVGSFGSCSFGEPVGDLRALGLLA